LQAACCPKFRCRVKDQVPVRAIQRRSALASDALASVDLTPLTDLKALIKITEEDSAFKAQRSML